MHPPQVHSYKSIHTHTHTHTHTRAIHREKNLLSNGGYFVSLADNFLSVVCLVRGSGGRLLVVLPILLIQRHRAV